MTFADAAVTLLNAFTVGVFVLKLGYVTRANRRRPSSGNLHDLVVALVLLAVAVALMAASLTLRFWPERIADVVRVVVPTLRAILLPAGIWLLVYWRRR